MASINFCTEFYFGVATFATRWICDQNQKKTNRPSEMKMLNNFVKLKVHKMHSHINWLMKNGEES